MAQLLFTYKSSLCLHLWLRAGQWGCFDLVIIFINFIIKILKLFSYNFIAVTRGLANLLCDRMARWQIIFMVDYLLPSLGHSFWAMNKLQMEMTKCSSLPGSFTAEEIGKQMFLNPLPISTHSFPGSLEKSKSLGTTGGGSGGGRVPHSQYYNSDWVVNESNTQY